MLDVGFVGGGKMAEALLAGMLAQGGYAAASLGVSDVSHARLDELETQYGLPVFGENRSLVAGSRAVVLAVKPQQLDAVLQELQGQLAGKTVISIAAGRTIAYFEAHMPAARIVRAMPNLACQAGEGMTALCAGTLAGEADLELARTVFRCSGQVLVCDEKHFDWVTALSGSGPAFWAQLCAYEVEAACQAGIPAETARMLVLQTMLGTATYLRQSGTAFDAFMNAVASKGGTTAAGLAVLRSQPVQAALSATLDATAHRSEELRG